jgi:hypothetical protein
VPVTQPVDRITSHHTTQHDMTSAFTVSPNCYPPRRLLQVLRARFDGVALQPPLAADASPAPAGPQPDPAQTALGQQLLHWCNAGAGAGAVPWHQPRQWAPVPTPLAAAYLTGTSSTQLLQWATRFALVLDGSTQLQAASQKSSSIGALAFKLQVKLHDACWWRQRQPADPWDCGFLPGTAAAQAQLAHFVPRRATLVLAHGLPAAVVQQALQQLQARQAAFVQPVRVLVLGETTQASTALAGWPQAARFEMG